MNKTLTIFFSPERTYLALIEPKAKGLELSYIASTSKPIDIENLDSSFSQPGLEEFYDIIKKIEYDYDLVSFSIPIENTILTEFPARPNISKDEILSIINIEIRQNLPQFNPQEFPTYLFELSPRKNQSYYLSIIIPKLIFKNLKTIASNLDKPVQKIEVSQINSHNAFLYNYPEEHSNVCALLNIADKFIDLSLIKGKEFLWYSLIKYNFTDEIPDLIANKLTEISTEIVSGVDSIFLYGTNLDKILIGKVTNKLQKKYSNIKRLNAFRMFGTNLDDSSRTICARLAHHFPACIGSAIPDYHNRIKIY